MDNCPVCKQLQIVPGSLADYKQLACYHYRDSEIGPFAAIFTLRPTGLLADQLRARSAGVIVYTMTTPALELRNVATAGFFAGLDRHSRLALLNKNVRRIARVIVDPRFRGLGLASRLVRQTMPLMNVPIIEALAVMGLFHPFFEKAGMQPYTAPLPIRCVRLIEALATVGIDHSELVRPQIVHEKINRLDKDRGRFIEREISLFLQSYGKRSSMQPGLKRTEYVLTKLTERPAYYIWFNPDLQLTI